MFNMYLDCLLVVQVGPSEIGCHAKCPSKIISNPPEKKG